MSCIPFRDEERINGGSLHGHGARDRMIHGTAKGGWNLTYEEAFVYICTGGSGEREGLEHLIH